MHRAITVKLASEIGGPALSLHASREQLIAWLQWCDPNGIHTDELAASDDVDPYTLESAWEAVRSIVDDT